MSQILNLFQSHQSVTTVFPREIKVALSVMPCPVGGAGGVFRFSVIVFPEKIGVIETNLFNK